MEYLDWQRFGEEEDTVQEAAEDKTADFETLIKGDYKEAFDSRVQKILDGRLRQLRQENERLRQAGETREQAELAAIDRLAPQGYRFVTLEEYFRIFGLDPQPGEVWRGTSRLSL